MKSPYSSLLRVLIGILSFVWLIPCLAEAQAVNSAMVAEAWPVNEPLDLSAKRNLTQLRQDLSGRPANALSLDGLSIPERDQPSLVRVRGVLIPPKSGGYTIQIYTKDEAEFWLGDDTTGEWKRVQTTGNPNTGAGRIKLEGGVGRAFEFWTTGSGRVSVEWESAVPVTPILRNVAVTKQVIPGASMRLREAKEGDRHGSGLKDAWKQKWGLKLESDDGPDGPWGDPDGDGLANWQEQMAGADPLRADAAGHGGFVRMEVWQNLPGKYVFDLTRDSRFPQKPDAVSYVNRLEIPVGGGNEYGSRMRGLIRAPLSGEYTFSIIGNDTAELWLGETDSPSSRRLIAKVDERGGQLRWTRGTGEREKTLFPEQISARIALEKDRSYYVEVLHKQDNKEDHCAVGWIIPGASKAEVIGGAALIAWQPDREDLNDDGLPDAWQQSTGLAVAGTDHTLRTAYADADHDGLTNWEEWKAGSDPLKADVPATEHRLTCDVWDGLAGRRIKDLVLSPAYPGKPTQTTLVDNMDFSDEGENYGVRLRGYVTAPEDGPYVFYIAGNSACRLYLADSEDKFGKRLVAETVSGTGWRAFGQNASQESEGVELKKGRKYYIEVLFKRGSRADSAGELRDHASVAWKRPGRSQAVIDAEFFSPYRGNTRDLDDDDLPDDWEIAHGFDPKDSTGENGAWGDPDGDLLENFRESQAALDPRTADVHGAVGFASWECWENVPGNLRALKAHSSFPLHPTQRAWVERFEGPQALGESYGSRLRAFLIPPTTGSYTFAIAGDNQCELWLSTSEDRTAKERIASVQGLTRQRIWVTELGQISSPVHLEAGKRYFLEAVHKQELEEDHVSVAWKVPGSNGFKIIPGKALAGYWFNDPNDLDGDDLPDDWEHANGLATNAFTDGDEDFDRDGLSIRDEFRLHTRGDLADTDGDGMSDYDEVRLYRSNPLVKDVVPPVKLADLPLGTAQSAAPWTRLPQGAIRSTARQGSVDLTFNLETSGIYRVDLQAVARAAGTYAPPIPVIVRVDGGEIGRGEVKPEGSKLRWLTMWLAAGTHIVSVDNRNVRSAVYLEISSLTLFRHEGEDTNGNGTPDWLDQLVRRGDRMALASSQSVTSPLCLEGTARFPGDVRLATAAGAVPVEAATAGRWFANVPLDAAGETKISGDFENGSLHEEVSVRWIATNLFEAPETIRIRVGDSLKVTALPPGAGAQTTVAQLSRDGTALGESTVGQPLIIRFEEPGTFTIAGSAATGAEVLEAKVKVEVIGADFGPAFSLASGSPRVWNLPNVPHFLSIEADSELNLTEQDRQATQSRRFVANYLSGRAGSPRVLARLAPNGPIVAATTIGVFRFVPATLTGNHHVVKILADGTRVVEVRYVIEGTIPADLSIWLQLYVTDAVFADGGTWHELTAADFDASGEAKLLIYKAAGSPRPYVCHWIRPFQKDHLDD